MTDPRLLLLDFTSISGPSATSTLKAAYFRDWRAGALLHVTDMGRGRLGAAPGAATPQAIYTGEGEIRRLFEAFEPRVILYRPVADSRALHDFAMAAIDAGLANGAGLALWIMDDWPSRLERNDPALFQFYDKDLRSLFSRASVNFAISDGMARAFADRYGVDFKVAHNGIDPKTWPQPARRRKTSVIIRYAGSLAPDMAKESVTKVAQTVSRLAERGVAVRFEGRTQSHWMEDYGATLNAMNAVSFKTSRLSEAAYRRWLCEADILLVAYNFDEATRTYLKYSFANKVPETMAAGAAILAYGPEELETITYLRQSAAAYMVTEDGQTAIEDALSRLIDDKSLREALGATAREHAFVHFDLGRMKARFKDDLIAIAGATPAKSTETAAKRAISLVSVSPPSAYRRFANAVHDKAPVVFTALQPVARGFRAARSYFRSS